MRRSSGHLERKVAMAWRFDLDGRAPMLVPALARKQPPRHLAQLLVNDGRQLLERLAITAAPGLKQAGQVGFGWWS